MTNAELTKILSQALESLECEEYDGWGEVFIGRNPDLICEALNAIDLHRSAKARKPKRGKSHLRLVKAG